MKTFKFERPQNPQHSTMRELEAIADSDPLVRPVLEDCMGALERAIYGVFRRCAKGR